MLEVLFTIGQLISASAMVYGAYLAVYVTFFPEKRNTSTIDELVDIARLIGA